MTPHEEDKKSMYDTVLGIFDKFLGVIATIPELALSVASFRSTVASITTYNEQVKTARKGKYESKKDAKHSLVSLMIPAVNSLHSYARKSKQQELIKLSEKTTHSGLERLNKAEFDTKVDSLYKSLDANKANLTGYNVTEESVGAIKASIDAYDAAEKDHLSSGSKKSAAHTSLEEAFDTADDILKEDIDGMMEHFKQSNSEFYNMYTAGRVIKDISGGKGSNEPPPEEPPSEEPPQPE